MGYCKAFMRLFPGQSTLSPADSSTGVGHAPNRNFALPITPPRHARSEAAHVTTLPFQGRVGPSSIDAEYDRPPPPQRFPASERGSRPPRNDVLGAANPERHFVRNAAVPVGGRTFPHLRTDENTEPDAWLVLSARRLCRLGCGASTGSFILAVLVGSLAIVCSASSWSGFSCGASICKKCRRCLSPSVSLHILRFGNR